MTAAGLNCYSSCGTEENMALEDTNITHETFVGFMYPDRTCHCLSFYILIYSKMGASTKISFHYTTQLEKNNSVYILAFNSFKNYFTIYCFID